MRYIPILAAAAFAFTASVAIAAPTLMSSSTLRGVDTVATPVAYKKHHPNHHGPRANSNDRFGNMKRNMGNGGAPMGSPR